MTTITDMATGDEIATANRIERSAGRRVFARTREVFTFRDDRADTRGACGWSNCPRPGRFYGAVLHGDGALEWTGPNSWCGAHFDIAEGLARLFEFMAGWAR